MRSSLFNWIESDGRHTVIMHACVVNEISQMFAYLPFERPLPLQVAPEVSRWPHVTLLLLLLSWLKKFVKFVVVVVVVVVIRRVVATHRKLHILPNQIKWKTASVCVCKS